MNVNNIPTLLEAGSCHTALPPQQTLAEVQIEPASQLNSHRLAEESQFILLFASLYLIFSASSCII